MGTWLKLSKMVLYGIVKYYMILNICNNYGKIVNYPLGSNFAQKKPSDFKALAKDCIRLKSNTEKREISASVRMSAAALRM